MTTPRRLTDVILSGGLPIHVIGERETVLAAISDGAGGFAPVTVLGSDGQVVTVDLNIREIMMVGKTHDERAHDIPAQQGGASFL